jgi:hypothetical protein
MDGFEAFMVVTIKTVNCYKKNIALSETAGKEVREHFALELMYTDPICTLSLHFGDN